MQLNARVPKATDDYAQQSKWERRLLARPFPLTRSVVVGPLTPTAHTREKEEVPEHFRQILGSRTSAKTSILWTTTFRWVTDSQPTALPLSRMKMSHS